MNKRYYEILWILYDTIYIDREGSIERCRLLANKVYDGDMSMRAAKKVLSNV